MKITEAELEAILEDLCGGPSPVLQKEEIEYKDNEEED